MHTQPANAQSRRARLIGYSFALAAGAIWGTTGPLSTALYAEGAQLTAVGFWRIFLATIGFIIYGLFNRGLFAIDRKGLLYIALLGGALVAVFEVGFQFAIAGLGVAPAVALLYVAPVIVAFLAHFMLREKLTGLRIALAVMVMVGVYLTMTGTVSGDDASAAASVEPFVGALLAMLLFNQQLYWFGWLGLAMVIGGVAGGAREEAS